MKHDSQGFGRVSRAAAGFARDPDIRQEVHLDSLLAGPVAGFAPAAGLVEAESAGRIASHLGLRKLGEQLADQVERAGIRRRCRIGRVSQRRLVDADHLVDMLQTLDRFVGTRGLLCAVQGSGRGLPQNVFDQRALARARNSRDGGHRPQRKPYIQVPQVMLSRAFDDDRRDVAVAIDRPALLRNRYRTLAAQVGAGQ